MSEAESELKLNLAWDLNKLLKHDYRQLYIRSGLEDLLEKAHAEHPGNEVAELIFYIQKKNGKPGLAKFYDLLVKLEQKASLDLIKESPAAELFLKKPIDQLAPVQKEEKSAEMDSKRTINNISALKRASIADAIIEFVNWDRLGIAFEMELGVTFSKQKLKAEKGNHATDTELAEYMMDKFAHQLLPVSAFKRALLDLGMASVAQKFAEELK